MVDPTYGQGIGKLLSDITYLNATLRPLFLRTASPSAAPPSIPPSFSRTYFKRQLPCTKDLYDANRKLDYGYGTTTPEAGETLVWRVVQEVLCYPD